MSVIPQTFPGNEKIERQVDLHLIRQNVDTGVYDGEGSKAFYADIQAMIDNVTSSFEPGSNEHVAATALRTFADEEMALVSVCSSSSILETTRRKKKQKQKQKGKK